jgi:hypothetical protein
MVLCQPSHQERVRGSGSDIKFCLVLGGVWVCKWYLTLAIVLYDDHVSDTFQGMIAMQNALPANDIPVGLAFLIFCQNFSASIYVVIATTIFTQSLTSGVKKYVPSVEPKAVIAAGGDASAVRKLVPPGSPELAGLLKAYSNSIDRVFYLLAGTAVLGVAFACGIGWKDVRKDKKGPEKDEETAEKDAVEKETS